MKSEQRSVSAERGAIGSLWGLLGLFIVKGTVGWITGSKALLADACHSAADCAGSATSYLSLRKARVHPNAAVSPPKQPSDQTVAIVLSALLLVAGIEMGISSIKSVANGVEEAPGVGAVIVIAASIAAREGIVRYKRSQDSRCGLRADRYGDRSDVFASLTALVGTSGALAGDVLDMPFLYVLDPAAGLVVSVFVLRMGYKLSAPYLRPSTGSKLDEVDSQMLLEATQRIDGVVMVDEIKAREHGHYILLDVVIRVNPRVSVFEGHDIAMRVKRHLTKRFLHVMDVNVNVQPYDPGYPYKSNHQDEDMSTLLQ